MERQSSKLHPELQQFRYIPEFTINRRNLWLMKLLTRIFPRPKQEEGILIENILIPNCDGTAQIRLRIYSPENKESPAPGILWMHGGGYIIGRPEMGDSNCIQFVKELGIKVVSVDYRLAPKYPFPIPLEDCYAALQWMNSHPQIFDINRIAIGGTSAGAGLAAALAQFALDRGEISPSFQLLVYPMLDDRTALRKDLFQEHYVAWNLESNQFGWESYLGEDNDFENPPAYAVPSRREDLSGLPPAWIGVGTLDLFHDECVEYANRLKRASIECELVVVPGVFHGFDIFTPHAQVVREFHQSQINRLQSWLEAR